MPIFGMKNGTCRLARGRSRFVMFGTGLQAGVIVKIPLDMDDGGALVPGAGGQVAQGADKIRQVPGVVPSDTMLPTRLTEASFSRIF